MTASDHSASLQEVVALARQGGLNIRAQAAGDLAVIGCTIGTKAVLTALVEQARGLGLSIKWCNGGTLVTIGVPTQRPSHGQEESSPKDSQSSQ